jgi:MoaA/NifB/PqqE/SkfB family radical SAM enzyme
MNTSSYISANTFPEKVLADGQVITDVVDHNIRPVHIQVNPTNACPQNCSFCSCKNRNQHLNLKYHQMKQVIHTFKELGTEACTITGGGDPLSYLYIRDLIHECYDCLMDVGLVTNGHRFDVVNVIKPKTFEFVTWCRISVSCEYVPKWDRIKYFVERCRNVDWAFSYVISNPEDFSNLKDIIGFANKQNFTHVRIVDDILAGTDNIQIVKKYLQYHKVNDSRVIYQGRKEYQPGHKRCLLSLLKPNVGPNGYIYPCCGIQYAKEPQALDFDKKDSMGFNIRNTWANQNYYDGSKCIRCYYSEYNHFLNRVWDLNKLKHRKFK